MFLIGETEADIFYLFSLTALVINLIIFSSTITILTIYCGEVSISRVGERTRLIGGGPGGGLEQWRNNGVRSGEGQMGERRGYGAMGFYYGELV